MTATRTFAITSGDGITLYPHNEGNGTFKDVTASAGLRPANDRTRQTPIEPTSPTGDNQTPGAPAPSRTERQRSHARYGRDIR